jgi:hypothetical protein
MTTVKGTSKTQPEIELKDGDIWINVISGMEYRWDAKQGLWIKTGNTPYGPNPMGFLGESFG